MTGTVVDEAVFIYYISIDRTSLSVYFFGQESLGEDTEALSPFYFRRRPLMINHHSELWSRLLVDV
jgi:hypothetical protein